MSITELVKPTLALAATDIPAAKNVVVGVPNSYNNNSNNNNNNCAQAGTPGRPKQQQSLAAMSLVPIGAQISEKEKIETNTTTGKGKTPSKQPDEFWKDLLQFHERRGTPITNAPKISGTPVDLYQLYNEVTERGGFNKVNNRDEWDEVYAALETMREKCVNGTAGIKYIYRRYLDKYERLNFFGEDPDKMEALEAAIENAELGSSRSRGRYSQLSSSGLGSIFGNQYANLHTVPMSYNYRQHIVNLERRRQFKLSTDLYKGTPLEKLMLSLISPLPNEQDFAINVCTLMTNEPKHSLRLSECPKIVDVLLAHTGVFIDYTVRKLFQHVYTNIRRHSQYAFWRDLLHDKPQILDLYTDEQAWLDNGLIEPNESKKGDSKHNTFLEECYELDFLNLGRGLGTQDYMGQRVLQVVQILRSLSFYDENINVLAKNRTLWRFLVMGANIRWSNIHIQALETAGNVASEFELLDPTTDELSRNLMATICEGIESLDRAVIINCLEILYKMCTREGNEENINRCLNLEFYHRICLLLSLNDVMLLIFTLEAIYALTSMGPRSCSLIMQVRGIVDQLVALITVEAQSYGPDGCILMRVVEIVPGNMLPMVAQNIANLQNVAAIKQQPATMQLPPATVPVAVQQHHVENVMQPQQQPLIVHNQSQSIVEQQPAPQITMPSMLPQPSLPQVQLPPITATTPASQQSFTHDDEQYALAWLGATFERAGTNESHVEQSELYRLYLTHCQKAGKHSVVNHVQFPRLVRLIFNQSVGPMIVRRTDGTELPGFYYVAIRLRAQPLPMQTKSNIVPAPMSPKLDGGQSARKKKKIKTENPTPMQTETEPISAIEKPSEVPVVEPTPVMAPKPLNIEVKADPMPQVNTAFANSMPSTGSAGFAETKTDMVEPKKEPPAVENITHPTVQQQPQHSTTSLIKSLLANKVNQRQQKQKELLPSAPPGQQISAQLSTPTQQHQQQVQQHTQQPIKVTSNAISALVNNPLMQHTPVKVGQTTIKPLNPQHALDKKPIHSESVPPPLAPLSGANVVTKDSSGRTVIIANQSLVDQLPGTLIKRKLTIDENLDHGKRISLDNTNSSNTAAVQEPQVTPSKNAANLYAEMAASILEDEDLEDIPPLAAPDMATPTQQQQQQQLLIPAKVQIPQSTASSMQSVQRQILFQTNAAPQTVNTTPSGQLKLTAGVGQQQIPTAMATIKTDQGLQTVPVILQSKQLDQGQPTQIIQQVIQQAPMQQQPQTQYVLATNQQGQTYLVAQQTQPPPPPPQTQTLLVTQTPQQQTTGTKTIIILQQQTLPGGNASAHGSQPSQIITTGPVVGGTQKMIMTTSQGQQVLVTPRPPTPQQQQIFINPQTGAATHIQHVGVPVSAGGPSQGVNNTTNTIIQRQLMGPTTSQPSQQPTAPGQISPSLLSQLNQIPATIKLHQPQPSTPITPQTPQQTTISRIGGKTVQLVQSPSLPASPAQTVQIPQLQQHQSIIQQHIISGPNEKRQVLLSGGRAIEIKETLITQTPPPVQQSQLNSQTIITTQPVTQSQNPIQSQQHIRAVIEQQQQQHPSIIQQKITMPIATPHQQQQQQQPPINVPTQASPTMKSANEMPSLIQSTPQIINKSLTIQAATPGASQQAMQSKPALSVAVPFGVKKPQPVQDPAKNIAQQKLGMPMAPVIHNNCNSVETSTNAAHSAKQMMSPIAVTKTEEKMQSTMTNTPCTSVAPPTPTSTSMPMPMPTTTPIPAGTATHTTQTATTPVTSATPATSQQGTHAATPVLQPTNLVPVDINWLFICDWRNCPRRKFKSLNDLQHHVCTIHCPDHLDPAAEIFCQWGTGPGLCDNIPRKRYSLMTHLIDRHLTMDSLRTAVQRRIATGIHNVAPAQPPVTIVRNVDHTPRMNSSSPALSTGSSSSSSGGGGPSAALPSTNIAGSSALHAIKRHTADFINPKELMDENEGPVTKSIRLTASLILRNLVTNTSTAKRSLRRYEPHLANVALSNVESSSTLSQILYELNN